MNHSTLHGDRVCFSNGLYPFRCISFIAPQLTLTDCDLTQQMVGVIKASSPGMKSMSADMFLDLLTMSAPSGEERTPIHTYR